MTTIPYIDELLDQMSADLSFGTMPLSSVVAEHGDLFRAIESFDPLRLAACFGGLLTVPELQSNCGRLEILTHLCFALARGTRKPTEKIVARLFKVLGDGMIGRQEDPAEDVFVSLIVTPRGNFRILEGIWESAGFHTQCFVNALELAVGINAGFTPVLDRVYALLKLSDLVCERAKLPRYVGGNVNPEENISPKILENVKSLRARIRFTEDELTAAGISLSELVEFGFDPPARFNLPSSVIGHSILERNPVVYRNGEIYLLLPTAVTAAIRRFVIERMERAKPSDFFASLLGYELADAVNRTALLGDRKGAPIEFQKTDNGAIAAVMYNADRGRVMHFVFFADTLENFDSNGGLVGTYPTQNVEGLRADIEKTIEHGYRASQKNAWL